MKLVTKFAINSFVLASSAWFFAGTAQAHAVLVEPSAQAGSNYKGAIRIGHGCEGSATTGIRISMPSGFGGAKPQPKSGWSESSKKGKLAQPSISQGQTITEDMVELEWKANTKEAALPDGAIGEFTFTSKLPDAAGATWLRILQTCEKGQNDWAEIPATGTSIKGLKMPAALLTIKTASASNVAVANANVTIRDSWVRPTVAGQKATGAFMKITAKENSKLLSVSSPVAGVAEVHEMKMEKDVMKMAAIPSLDLPAGKSVELKPGSYHIMLMDLKSPVEKGTKLPLTLKFQDAKGGKFQVDLLLDAAMPMAPGQPGGASPHHHH